MRDLDADGSLDQPKVVDVLLMMNDVMTTCGADPEDDKSYRSMIAMCCILMTAQPGMWPFVVAGVMHGAYRAIRDLDARNGGS